MKRVAIYGWAAVAVAVVFAAGLAGAWLTQPHLRVLTQKDIDTAVLHTLETKSLPSRATRAAETVREAVVRIRNFPAEEEAKPGPQKQADKVTPTPRNDGDAQAAPRQPSLPDQLAEKNKPADNPADKPNDKPADKSADNSADKPADKTPDNSADKPAEKPADNTADKPADKLADNSDGKGKPADKDKSVDKDKPGDKDKPADKGKPEGKERTTLIGSGVVVTDSGVILTNYHVIAGARRLVITFYDGHESEASVLSVMPEKDLAVIRAKSLPDDLKPATMAGSRDLMPGDDVVAVGFPFGIGPSVSSGVVSGLNRKFVSEEHDQDLENLIQFDAAANPGNSGGPLINMDGEVVGIVTAILNPHNAGTFVGIGFATTIESAGGAVGLSPY
jgi:S1-C subfamily serine protease